MSEPSPNAKRRWIAAVAVLLLVALGLGWYFWPDPELARVRELRQQITALETREAPPEERVEVMKQIRTEVEKLPESKRQAAGRELFGGFRAMMKKRIDDYARLTTDVEKTAYLDKQIAEMESFRKLMGPPPGDGGGTRGGPPGGPGPFGGPPGAGPGGPGGRGMSDQDRNERRKEMMSQQTGEDRARFLNFMRDMEARRTQLGLSPMPFGPPPQTGAAAARP